MKVSLRWLTDIPAKAFSVYLNSSQEPHQLAALPFPIFLLEFSLAPVFPQPPNPLSSLSSLCLVLPALHPKIPLWWQAKCNHNPIFYRRLISVLVITENSWFLIYEYPGTFFCGLGSGGGSDAHHLWCVFLKIGLSANLFYSAWLSPHLLRVIGH